MWQFSIPEHQVTVPFLLVGASLEPHLHIDRPRLSFKPTLVGRHLKETIRLINTESIPFSFYFKHKPNLSTLSSLTANASAAAAAPHALTTIDDVASYQAEITFNPISGTVAANSHMDIVVDFCPTTEGAYNLNFLCHIRKKPLPLFVNIKGEGYQIHAVVQVELLDNSLLILQPATLTEYSLGIDNTQNRRHLDVGSERRSVRPTKYIPKSRHLSTNFSPGHLAHLKDASKQANTLLQSSGVIMATLDFGSMRMNDKSVRRVILTNHGRVNFDFKWKLSEVKQRNPALPDSFIDSLRILPESGTVFKGDKVVCEVSVSVSNHDMLLNALATCQILNGESVHMEVRAKSCPYRLTWSGNEHDFSLCPILEETISTTPLFVASASASSQPHSHQQYKSNAPLSSHHPPPLCHSFTLTNDDDVNIVWELDKSQSIADAFEVQIVPENAVFLRPGEKADVCVYFRPKLPKVYVGLIGILVNGVATRAVTLKVAGEGVALEVAVLKPEMKQISFGPLRAGQQIVKSLKLVNRSTLAAPISLLASSIAVLDSIGVQLSIPGPHGNLTMHVWTDTYMLSPRAFLDLEISWKPERRCAAFSEHVSLVVGGKLKPGFVVSGACLGVDVQLDVTQIAFGAIVLNSSTTNRVHLLNKGDIGCKFTWDTSRFFPNVSISASEGYLPSGTSLPLTFTFHPHHLSQEITFDAQCTLHHLDKAPTVSARSQIAANTPINSTQLTLRLRGACIAPSPHVDVLKFSAPVRQSDTRTLTLTNKTTTDWQLKPLMENAYWTLVLPSSDDGVQVAVGESRSLEICYRPMEMTVENSRHEGSLFFPLSDGSGMLYKFLGVAERPQPDSVVTRDIVAKTQHVELLLVKNWLNLQQRFKVSYEVTKPDPSVFITIAEWLDVAPLATKECKVSFFAYKEGVTNVKFSFKNEITGEFLIHVVTFKASAPSSLAAGGTSTSSTLISIPPLTQFFFQTTVRQLSAQELLMRNPLTSPVTFTTTLLPSIDNFVIPHQFVIPPRSEINVFMEYLPLHVKEANARLSINSTELGVFLYDLKFAALPAPQERGTHFKVSLGSSHAQTLRFICHSKVKAEFVTRLENPDFIVDKGFFVAAG